MKKTALLLAMLLFLLALAACTAQQAALSVDELLSLGEQYLLELDYEQALAQFLKVIELEPMNPRGYTGAAEAYLGQGDVDSAIDILEQGWDLTANTEIDAMLDRIWDMREDDTQLWESGDAPAVRYESPEEAYRELLASGGYYKNLGNWEDLVVEMQGCAILDIDQNGVPELLLVFTDNTDDHSPNDNVMMIYSYDSVIGNAAFVEYSLCFFASSIEYSPQYRCIVYDFIDADTGTSLQYSTISDFVLDMVLTAKESVFDDETIKYYVQNTRDRSYEEITQAEYVAYGVGLQPIQFDPFDT